MADGEPSPSSPASGTGGGTAASPLSQYKKESRRPIDAKMAELNESQAEVAARLQGLKQELQNWRLKLDTQVRTYKEELSELKKSLGTDVEQLKSEFEALRTTLQQQQEDVAHSLRNLGMKDDSKDVSEPGNLKPGKEIMEAEEKPEKLQSAASDNKVPDS